MSHFMQVISLIVGSILTWFNYGAINGLIIFFVVYCLMPYEPEGKE